jgi:ankyrin repeat protein
MYAAANGHLALIELVQKAGLRKNSDTALAFAARGCYTPIVRVLMAGGAKPNAKVQGTPALTLAAAANCEETVQFLVKNGAEVNGADDNDGMTALMEAAAWGHVPMVRLLLDNGADMEIRNKQGQTAWTLAAVGQHVEVAELFRKAREAKR